MKKRYTKKIEYVLDENEAKIIRECLNYIYHRQEYHNKVSFISSEEVKRLRREFGVFK